LDRLDATIDDLLVDREGTFKKLNELKNLIADAKARQGKDDPELLGKLKQLDLDARQLEKELKDTDEKINDL